MVDPPEGHVESAHDGNTSPNTSDGEAQERNQAPPHVLLEQLREQSKELEEARF
jgi:hypothetical protein